MDHGWYGSIVQYILFVTSCDALRWVCPLWVLTPRTLEGKKTYRKRGKTCELRILEGWQGNHLFCCFVFRGVGWYRLCGTQSWRWICEAVKAPLFVQAFFLSRYIACIVYNGCDQDGKQWWTFNYDGDRHHHHYYYYYYHHHRHHHCGDRVFLSNLFKVQ